ncbi:MAG: thioredoxin family protein [Clostridia bacterium]|nr:thioredoxin family protein [Clostridia bacterium]
MKEIIMFTMAVCPYCRRARHWMKEIIDGNHLYANLEIKIIDELLHPFLAAKYDYYYVPAFYIGERKVHEGIATREIIESVFRRALDP